jgi:DNA-binding NarL/FixJ family response regulator
MSQDAVKIRALAVNDDHPILREGIAALIADETDIALVGDRTQPLSSAPELDTGDADATGADRGAETCEDT